MSICVSKTGNFPRPTPWEKQNMDDFVIREATEADIPAIVQLLKESLGEKKMPKSEAFWRWKHIDNPFGASPVLLAEREGKLLALRAMMRWQWTSNGITYLAWRAVDTATHPAQQRKGFFNKLTMMMVEMAKKEEQDFIYNTPNQQSMPGYLKMGWELFGQPFVYVRPVIGFQVFKHGLWHQLQQSLQDADFDEIDEISVTGKRLETKHSSGYFRWRYQQCPQKDYGLFRGEENNLVFWLFIKTRQHRWGRELRVCDYLYTGDKLDRLPGIAGGLASGLGCRFVSMSPHTSIGAGTWLRHGYFKIQKGMPFFTLRALNDRDFFGRLMCPESWQWQIGDLELF